MITEDLPGHRRDLEWAVYKEGERFISIPPRTRAESGPETHSREFGSEALSAPGYCQLHAVATPCVYCTAEGRCPECGHSIHTRDWPFCPHPKL